MPVSNTLRLLGAFFCVYVVWGTNFLAIRYMVETIPPLMAMGVRSVIAGGILYGWARFRGAGAPDRSEWKAAALVGAFLFWEPTVRWPGEKPGFLRASRPW